MAISRFSSSRVTQGLPKYQSAWDSDNVQQGALVPIQQIVATTNTADLTFNNVPQIYQDLMIVFNGRRTDAASISNPACRKNPTAAVTSLAGNSNAASP